MKNNRPSCSPLIVLSILNWNGWQDTIECLESVYAQDYPNFLTVVVDNGSWDGSADRIHRWAIEHLGAEAAVVAYDKQQALAGGRDIDEVKLEGSSSRKRLVLIRSRENLGWAGGNNLVIAYALRRKEVRFIFFLNNDAVVSTGCLSALADAGSCITRVILGAVERIPGELGATQRLSFSLPRFLFSPLVSPRRPARARDRLSESGVVSGAAMLVSRKVLEDFRLRDGECFSSKIFLYWEDQLFCHLARGRGAEIASVPGAEIRHRRSASFGGALGPLLFYYRERGKILAARAALPFGLLMLFHVVNPLLCLARAAKYSVSNPACSRATLCGLADGLRGIGGKWRNHDRFSRQLNTMPSFLVEREES